MARPDTARRRVSNLVGRFEQLAQAAPVRTSDGSSQESPSPTSPRPSSHHGEKVWQQHDRRSFSLSSIPSSLEARLDKELRRNKQLRDECEVLRRRCYQDDERVTALCRKLEEGTEMQQTLHVQTSGLQTKVDRLADKLTRRDEVQRAEYERRIVTVANERDILASRLKAAEGAVERAQAAEERSEIAAKQLQTLRCQLLELKTDVALRSGGRGSVSDQEIFAMMNTLNHLIQNWVVNTFRKIKIDPNEISIRFKNIAALHGTKLLRTLYADFDSSSKIFLFQATVMYLIMPIFDTTFFGLPKELQGLAAAAQEMKSSMMASNEWRASTAEFLSCGDPELTARCKAACEQAQIHLVDEICAVMSALTSADVSEAQARTLKTVIEHAVSLSRLFDGQHAVYQCWLPDSNASEYLKFDADRMEDVMGEEEGELLKEVKCVMFPALLKTGLEKGESMDTINVLMKAKVLCVEDDDDEGSVD